MPPLEALFLDAAQSKGASDFPVSDLCGIHPALNCDVEPSAFNGSQHSFGMNTGRPPGPAFWHLNLLNKQFPRFFPHHRCDDAEGFLLRKYARRELPVRFFPGFWRAL